MKQRLSFLGVLFIAGLSIAGCTGGGSGDPSGTESSSVINSAKGAQKLISDVQTKINQDPQYVLSKDDLLVLSNEGLTTESELKAWVQ